MADTPQPELDASDFGPNIWLVDEMYRRYREHPDSVSEAWNEFFEDYQAHAPDLIATATAAVPVGVVVGEQAAPIVEPSEPLIAPHRTSFSLGHDGHFP